MIEGDPIEKAKTSGFKVEITRKGSSQTTPQAPKQASEIRQDDPALKFEKLTGKERLEAMREVAKYCASFGESEKSILNALIKENEYLVDPKFTRDELKEICRSALSEASTRGDAPPKPPKLDLRALVDDQPKPAQSRKTKAPQPTAAEPEPEEARHEDPAPMPATEAPPTSTPGPVTPGRGDTRPTPTSSVTVPLIEGIEMEIAAAPGGGWITQFTRNGDTLTEDRSNTEPWIDRRAPGRLTKALAAAVPTLNEKAIKDAITAIFDGILESPDGAALISEPAARVISATEAVTVEMCDPPVYRVDLIDGATLTFSNREMAALQPVTLNDRWLAAHPGDPLKATRRDFEEIQEYWFSILEKADPAGSGSVWESIAADLQFAIAGREAGTDKISLLKTGVYQEPGGPLWVSGRVIAEVLRKAGKNENDPGLSQFLKRRGDLIEASKPFRVSRILIRAWGFSPDFMPEVDETASPIDFHPDGEDS